MKTILITGANKGIGYEIARELGSRGHKIIISGRDEVRIHQAALELEREGVSVQALVMDVSDIHSIHAARELLSQSVPQLDVLINNAGILLDRDTYLPEISASDWLQTFQTNAFGAFFTAQAFLPMMAEGGRIINMSSSGGQICNGISTWSPAYCISKTALNAITLQLAAALAPRGIAVNAMSPGWVRTDMGGGSADRSVEKGAETAVWLATEADQTLTGKFWMDRKEISW